MKTTPSKKKKAKRFDHGHREELLKGFASSAMNGLLSTPVADLPKRAVKPNGLAGMAAEYAEAMVSELEKRLA